MDWKKEYKSLLWIIGVFIFLYYLPIGTKRFDHAIIEAFNSVSWYACEQRILWSPGIEKKFNLLIARPFTAMEREA